MMYLAQALGQQGDSAAASKVLERAQARHSLRSELYAPELALAKAWTAAATHDLDGAIAFARDAARIAKDSGQWAMALHALHDAVRLGDTEAVQAIAEVMETVDCAAGRAALDHGRALWGRDAAALDTAAGQLTELGMSCAAADAYAQAAVIHSAAHDRRGELTSMGRAREIRGDAWTPALERVLSPLPLTGREREIALMVADGMSNKAIAQRLSVSVRTVEGHIYRACTKLDVPDRTTLGHAVAAAKSGSPVHATEPGSYRTL